MVGCCGIYALSIPFLFAFTATTGRASWPVSLVVILGMTINAPHYGATLVRLYERREDRRKYVLFTVHVTIAVAALFVLGTRNLWLASAIITAYVTWSPWHFSAQNYGLLLMFLRRQDIGFDDTTKRLFYASFVFSTAMTIMGVQATTSDLVFAPGTFHGSDMPRVFLWDFLRVHASLLLWTTGMLYAGCLGAALMRLSATTRGSLGPAAPLLIAQALFTAVPVAAARVYTGGEITLAFAPVWISMAHSAQYLWVSAYFARRSGAQKSSARFLGKSFLAGSGITILPAVLFGPSLLGERPFDAGLAGLVFAVVNLHHFIMDGAIWKLRDGRVSNVLLRKQAPTPDPMSPRPTSRLWIPACIWTACTLSLVVPLVSLYETSIGIPTARMPARIDTAFDRLRWVGRESIGLHNYVGREYLNLDQPGIAEGHFRRSITLHPTPHAWTGLGNSARSQGFAAQARRAYDEALALDADFPGALMGAARTRAIDPVSPSADDVRQARHWADRLFELHPGQPEVEQLRSRLAEIETRQ